MKPWEKLSLRTRLTILHSSLLVFIVSILGVTFFIDTRNLLIKNTASHMRARAKPIIEHWLYTKGHSPTSHDIEKIAKFLARDLTSRNTVALILGRDGKPIANGKFLPEEPLPPPPSPLYYRQALAGKNEVNYIISYGNCHTLVILIPLRKSPKSDEILGVVQLSSPLTQIEKTLLSHSLYLGEASIITLFMGFVLSFLLTSKALSGLKQIITTCQKISAGNLKKVDLSGYYGEIGQLAKAFDEMVCRIESMLYAQRRFVANAAHELRTPLTALLGSAEVLLRGAQDDPSLVSRLCHGMYQEAKRLENLCERLLDLARLETSTKVQKKQINLEEFFKEFIKEIKPLAKDRNIFLEKGVPVNIFADPYMLKQILFDLVDNSTRYTDRNGSIALGWEVCKSYVEIWVKDNGEGILQEDIPHIFEPFYRGKTTIFKHPKGTGLGLALVRSMVEAQNGSIKVESKVGEGTTFLITLPV